MLRVEDTGKSKTSLPGIEGDAVSLFHKDHAVPDLDAATLRENPDGKASTNIQVDNGKLIRSVVDILLGRRKHNGLGVDCSGTWIGLTHLSDFALLAFTALGSPEDCDDTSGAGATEILGQPDATTLDLALARLTAQLHHNVAYLSGAGRSNWMAF